jgi:hypothetical protein
MKLIFNIFIKDLRRHWPEALASLALMIAYVYVEIRQWPREDRAFGWSGLTAFQWLSRIMVPLLLLAWTFLIIRVVQSEALVGDRQFWVTRPYDWKKLLAAKALFILSFLNFPLFVMQAFLLARAGFHPGSYLYGLLWMQLTWLMFFLSAAAVTSVTANMGQMLLATLFLGLYGAGIAVLSQVIPDADYPAGNDWWSPLLLVGTVVAVILLQYRWRRTALSRRLIVAFGCYLALLTGATPYRKLMARAYPLNLEAESPIRLALLPGVHHGANAATRDDDEEEIHLPFRLSGLPNGSILHLDGTILILTNSAGIHWDSGWKSQYELLFPVQKTTQIVFQIKRKVFDQIKSAPVNAKLLLTFTLYHDQNQRRFVPPAGEFKSSDLGLCSYNFDYLRGLHCLLPLRKPAFLLVSSEMAASTCPADTDDSPAPPGLLAHRSIQGDSDPAEFGVSPIQAEEVYLSNMSTYANDRGICPGTPLILSNPEVVRKGRIELQFDKLSIADYLPDPGPFRITLRR